MIKNSFDIFKNRRGYNERCKWWCRNENDTVYLLNDDAITPENDEYWMNKTPSGTFWANEVYSQTEDNNVIGGSFMFDKTTTTIKTRDNVSGLTNNDIILYQDNLWRVISVQTKEMRKQGLEFAKRPQIDIITFISLRR